MNIDALLADIRTGARVYIIGNGGSFANAEHLAVDLILCNVPAFTIPGPTITALANDFSYASALSLWLDVVARPGDILIALSGSGTSANIVSACSHAEIKGMRVHRVFGAAAGLGMQAAEEAQQRLAHDLMRALR
jgi:D-sedoheptulose 7-phosphate isomerase